MLVALLLATSRGITSDSSVEVQAAEDSLSRSEEVPPVSEETPVDFLQVDKPPVMIGGPAALYALIVYPAQAEQAGVEGVAQILFTVGSDGKSRGFEVRGVKPKGLGFAEAAIAALQQVDFKPGELDEKPVAVRMAQTVQFAVSTAASGKKTYD